jgi:arginyl-tRNA synthetase
VITADLRHAIARAVADAGFDAGTDPGLRPGARPGQYASSVAFALAGSRPPEEIAAVLAKRVAARPWVARAEVTGHGYLSITVTPQALAALPERVAAAGPASAGSHALAGSAIQAPPAADLLAAATWEEARAALAAELTVRLAAAAGATLAVPVHPERTRQPPQPHSPSVAGGGATFRSEEKRGEAPPAGEPHGAKVTTVATGERRPGEPGSAEVAAAVAFAGADAVRFALARAAPGRPVRIDPAKIARYVPDNPAYAVRYAHARAASGVRWAATLGAGAVLRCLPADPGELALLDALSWLPERVAIAARRGRPDEFARYLEELASITITTLSSASHPGSARAPGTDKLALARAARAGLAAGLGLLGVSAPDRL